MGARFLVLLHLALGLAIGAHAQAAIYQQCGGIGWSVLICVMFLVCAVQYLRHNYRTGATTCVSGTVCTTLNACKHSKPLHHAFTFLNAAQTILNAFLGLLQPVYPAYRVATRRLPLAVTRRLPRAADRQVLVRARLLHRRPRSRTSPRNGPLHTRRFVSEFCTVFIALMPSVDVGTSGRCKNVCDRHGQLGHWYSVAERFDYN